MNYPIPTTCPFCGGKVTDSPTLGLPSDEYPLADNIAYRCEHHPERCQYYVTNEAQAIATATIASCGNSQPYPHLAACIDLLMFVWFDATDDSRQLLDKLYQRIADDMAT